MCVEDMCHNSMHGPITLDNIHLESVSRVASCALDRRWIAQLARARLSISGWLSQGTKCSFQEKLFSTLLNMICAHII